MGCHLRGDARYEDAMMTIEEFRAAVEDAIPKVEARGWVLCRDLYLDLRPNIGRIGRRTCCAAMAVLVAREPNDSVEALGRLSALASSSGSEIAKALGI